MATEPEENLSGTSDQRLFEICQAENRCLVSLDMDFADILRFPPGLSKGIVVLRPPQNPTPALLSQMVLLVLEILKRESVDGRLWIAEPGRIRVHEPGHADDDA